MAQHLKPRIVTDGLMFNLDTLGGRGSNTIITKPTVIDDCVLWLDADDESTVITSGTNITNWLDKSGNGNDSEVKDDAEHPQYDGSRVNGRRVVNFVATSNSSGDALKGDFASGSQPFSGSTGGTIIIVMKQKSFVGTEFVAVLELAQGAYLSGSYGNRLITNIFGSAYSSADGSVNVIRMASGAGTTNYTARIENGPAVIAAYSNDGSTTRTYVNGFAAGTHSEDKADDARTHYCLGDDMTSGDHFNGYICEVIVYNRTISDVERQQVELYLSRKWNILLNSKERTYTNPATARVSNTKYGKLDQVGNSLYFTGGPNTTGGYKDYINCGNVLGNGTTYSSGENFTYEAWACDHGSETTWKTIIGSSSMAQIYFYATSSKIRMFKNGGGVGGTELLTADGQLHEWFHIVGTYNGQSLNQSFSGTMTSDGPIRRKLYVNGNMVDSDRESFFGGNIGDSYIGSYHANGLERAPMELAVARIYNRELSHEEIKQNYNAQKSRIDAIPKIAKPANLVLYLDAGMFESYKGSGSGTTIYDLSGNGNDGTIDGATYPANTVLAENDMGRYFDFDGTNDEIVVGDAGTLDLTTQMTQELWLQADSFSHGGGGNFPTVIAKNSQNYRIYFNTDGTLVVRNNSSSLSDLNSSTTLSTGIWYHIVVTKSSTGFSLYIDGELNNSDSQTGAITANNDALVIGNWDEGGARAWDGKVAMVRIYNVALSADEVMQNYNYSRHRFGK